MNNAEYFNRETKKIVPAFFFDANKRGLREAVSLFAQQWGQLGVEAEYASSGDSNGYGSWEGLKLVTPEQTYTQSLYIVWHPSTLDFLYIAKEDFQKDYLLVTEANREAVETIQKEAK